MRSSKNIFASLLCLVCVLSAGSAFASFALPGASTFGSNGSSLVAFMGNAQYTSYSGSLNGAFDVTALFTETANTISFNNPSGSSLFNNRNTSTWGTKTDNDLAGSSFSISGWLGGTVGVTNPYRVNVLSLLQDVNYKGTLLSAGTLIIGLEDTAGVLGGCDYNDFVLAAAKTAPTPVPAAVWLLGSGLLGAMGFKRVRKAKASA